jgi:hypothetical protein
MARALTTIAEQKALVTSIAVESNSRASGVCDHPRAALYCASPRVAAELCPSGRVLQNKERFASNGTGLLRLREEDPSSRWSSGRLARSLAVRDPSASFAVLTSFGTTYGDIHRGFGCYAKVSFWGRSDVISVF